MSKIASRLIAFALLVQVCVAHYEDVVLDREDIVRLSQIRAETSRMDIDRKCEALEGELRHILSAKVGPIEGRGELFSAMISILSNRKLPFNNDQPIMGVLEACLSEQSHRADSFKREVIASPSLSRQKSLSSESSSQSAMKEAIGEFQEVKNNIKDFGKDLYHRAADSIGHGHESDHHHEHEHGLDHEHHSEHSQHSGHGFGGHETSGHFSGDLEGHHHDEHVEHHDEHVEHHSIDGGHPSGSHYEHEIHHHEGEHSESHSSNGGGMGGFVSNLADQLEDHLDDHESHHGSHHDEFNHHTSDHHDGAFANGLADRLADQMDGAGVYHDQHSHHDDQVHHDAIHHTPESYTDSYHEHSVHDNGAHAHGKEEIVHNDVAPDGSQRSSYVSVNEYSQEHQHSSDSSSPPMVVPQTIVDHDHDHLVAAKEAQLRALEHEVSVKQEEINYLNEKIQALGDKYAHMVNNPPTASSNPIGDARFQMMKEQYEQAARREETTTKLLNIAKIEIAEKDKMLQVLIEKDRNQRHHNHHYEHDEDDDDDDDDDSDDDDDDDDDDYRKYHRHHRKSFGVVDIADKLQDKMDSMEPLQHRCYKYYLAFDANQAIDKETTKKLGKTRIAGPVPNYRISNMDRMREISDTLLGSGVKRAFETGREIRACFLDQRNLWWENNNSVYQGYSTLRSGGQIPPIPPMPPMPSLGRR